MQGLWHGLAYMRWLEYIPFVVWFLLLQVSLQYLGFDQDVLRAQLHARPCTNKSNNGIHFHMGYEVAQCPFTSLNQRRMSKNRLTFASRGKCVLLGLLMSSQLAKQTNYKFTLVFYRRPNLSQITSFDWHNTTIADQTPLIWANWVIVSDSTIGRWSLYLMLQPSTMFYLNAWAGVFTAQNSPFQAIWCAIACMMVQSDTYAWKMGHLIHSSIYCDQLCQGWFSFLFGESLILLHHVYEQMVCIPAWSAHEKES